LQRAGHLDRGKRPQIGTAQRGGRRIHNPVEVPFDGSRIERCVVVELQIGAQIEAHDGGAYRRHRRKARLDLQVGRDPQKRVVQRPENIDLEKRRHESGVECHRIRDDADIESAAAPRRLGLRVCGGKQARHDAGGGYGCGRRKERAACDHGVGTSIVGARPDETRA